MRKTYNDVKVESPITFMQDPQNRHNLEWLIEQDKKRMKQADTPEKMKQLKKQGLPRYMGDLPDDVWQKIDSTVIDVVKTKLRFYSTLKRYNMVEDDIPIGKLLNLWYTVGDVSEDAIVSMAGDQQPDNEDLDLSLHGVPVPMIHTGFRIPWRVGKTQDEMSGVIDLDIPTNMISKKAYKVAEAIEDMMLNGHSISLNGYSPAGATNHSSVITSESLSDDWADTGEKEHIYDDVLSLRKALTDLEFPEEGPFVLFIPSRYSTVFQKYRNEYRDTKIKETVMAIDGIDDIVTLADLPDQNDDGVTQNYVMLMYMSKQTMTVKQAAGISTMNWQGIGAHPSEYYKTFCAMTPKITPDENGRLGIVYASD